MGHDATKVVMGATSNTFKVVTSHKGTIAAGYIVRQKSDGTLSLAKADGEAIGISLGADLSNAGYTAVCRSGLKVPVILDAGFTAVLGTQVHINDTTGDAEATTTGVTGVNGIYSSGVLTGIGEDGNDKRVALMDFEGGL